MGNSSIIWIMIQSRIPGKHIMFTRAVLNSYNVEVRNCPKIICADLNESDAQVVNGQFPGSVSRAVRHRVAIGEQSRQNRADRAAQK